MTTSSFIIQWVGTRYDMVRSKMKMKSEFLLMLATNNAKHKSIDRTRRITYNMLAVTKTNILTRERIGSYGK